MQNHLKDELYNVLSGKSKVRFGTIIQAIACYLNDGEKTSPDAEVQKYFKEQERKRLNLYISQHNLWIDTIDFSQYETLYAVVQQNYVSITTATDLKQVKDFLTKNGFVNNRNNDYFNPELGIILYRLEKCNSPIFVSSIGLTLLSIGIIP